MSLLRKDLCPPRIKEKSSGSFPFGIQLFTYRSRLKVKTMEGKELFLIINDRLY